MEPLQPLHCHFRILILDFGFSPVDSRWLPLAPVRRCHWHLDFLNFRFSLTKPRERKNFEWEKAGKRRGKAGKGGKVWEMEQWNIGMVG